MKNKEENGKRTLNYSSERSEARNLTWMELKWVVSLSLKYLVVFLFHPSQRLKDWRISLIDTLIIHGHSKILKNHGFYEPCSSPTRVITRWSSRNSSEDAAFNTNLWCWNKNCTIEYKEYIELHAHVEFRISFKPKVMLRP